MQADQHKLVSIQYIRAIAAVVVVVWHTGWARTVLGQSGVDLFFVVSGFVMMLVSSRERSSGKFALARVARIVPLYWAVTLLVAFLYQPHASDLLESLVFWPDGGFPVVIQGWSLNLEMFYYFLFSLTLLISPRWRLQVLAVEMFGVCVVSPLAFPASVPLAAWSNPLAFEFLAGGCLYVLWRRHEVPVGLPAWGLGAVGVGCFACTHFLGGAPAGWIRVAFWGLPALAIVAAGLGIERAGQLPRLPWLGALGEASYSIYLTHVLTLSFIAGSLHLLWAPLAVTIAILWTCVAGLVAHYAFELPMLRLTGAGLRAMWPKAQPVPS